MAKKQGGNPNFNDEAIISSVSVDSSTAVVLCPSADMRFFLEVSNTTNQIVWLRFYAAATDNTKQGIAIQPNDSWKMPPEDKYIGEVSVIMAVGAFKTIHFTEIQG